MNVIKKKKKKNERANERGKKEEEEEEEDGRKERMFREEEKDGKKERVITCKFILGVLEPNIVAVLVVACHQDYIFIIYGIIGAQNNFTDHSDRHL